MRWWFAVQQRWVARVANAVENRTGVGLVPRTTTQGIRAVKVFNLPAASDLPVVVVHLFVVVVGVETARHPTEPFAAGGVPGRWMVAQMVIAAVEGVQVGSSRVRGRRPLAAAALKLACHRRRTVGVRVAHGCGSEMSRGGARPRLPEPLPLVEVVRGIGAVDAAGLSLERQMLLFLRRRRRVAGRR